LVTFSTLLLTCCLHLETINSDMIAQGYLMYGILIFVNTAVYVMIQMYFEGHEAFNDPDTTPTTSV